jgi:hypothetical protein
MSIYFPTVDPVFILIAMVFPIVLHTLAISIYSSIEEAIDLEK